MPLPRAIRRLHVTPLVSSPDADIQAQESIRVFVDRNLYSTCAKFHMARLRSRRCDPPNSRETPARSSRTGSDRSLACPPMSWTPFMLFLRPAAARPSRRRPSHHASPAPRVRLRSVPSVPAGRSGKTRYRSSAVLSQTRTSTSSGSSRPNSRSTPRGR